MKRFAAQFLAIVRYEFLMHWRRRALVVLFLAALALPAMMVFSGRDDFESMHASARGISPEMALIFRTTYILVSTWPSLFLIAALLVPPIVADTVPRDRQLRVRELLDSLPLGHGAYLAGKLAGVWVALGAGLCSALIALGLAWLLLIGPFDVATYAAMGLCGAVAIAGINGGLAVLIAAGQPGRARAVLIGVALTIAAMLTINIFPEQPGNWWELANPGHSAIFIYYTTQWITQLPGEHTAWHVLGTLLAGAAEIAVLLLLARAWLIWKWRTT